MTDMRQAFQAIRNLERVVGEPESRPLELALEHAQAWAQDRTGLTAETRGGSSHPVEIEERQEALRVQRMARDALERIPALLKSLEADSFELYQLVQSLTATVTQDKLPFDEPGCRSCARAKMVGRQRIGGTWSPIYEKSKASGLCRWCYDRVVDGELPPVDAVHEHNLGHHMEATRLISEWVQTRAVA